MGKPAGLAKEQQRALDRLKLIPAIDLVRYPYARLQAPQKKTKAGVPVAGLLDLAAMKLAALARRGLRRDFWDLFVILDSGISLKEAGRAYVRRFGLAQPDLYHVARSLTYFADAEKDPVYPEGLSRREWERIKSFFGAEASKLLRK